MPANPAFGVLDSENLDDLDELSALPLRSSVADVEKAFPAEEKPKLARIPSFSIEDRRERETLSRAPWVSLVRSDLLIGCVFTVSYLIPHLARANIGSEVAWIGVFIFWHLCVTIAKSIPDNTSSAEELNMRTNASTFVAMVLYPALGVWSCERFDRAENIFPTHLQRDGAFQWGTIFPVFMWGMSALVLVRESYSAVAVDNSVVVTDRGSASLGLFRRHPAPLEKLTSVVGSFATASLWQVLPEEMRPAGGAGRFCFQLMSPVVLLFLYIGLRFILFSSQNIHRQALCYPLVCELDYFSDIHSQAPGLLRGIFIIWCMFTTYCVVIRGFVTSRLFLRLAVGDSQTRKWLSVRWPLVTVPSKRQRVLWAFRGLAGSFVPYYYVVVRGLPEKVDGAGDGVLWYLYLCVYISFLWEGVGALFFALHEAERGCHLKTPFLWAMKTAFWASYNTFLQPLGTAVNVILGLVNGEFQNNVKLTELFGPLLNSRGELRGRIWKRHVAAASLSQEDLDEWIATWKRKRESVGKSTDTLDIVEPEKPGGSERQLPVIFRGTVFPTWHERNQMMNHPGAHVSLKPWEQHDSDEKFLRWHPTYQEEVLRLLSEPYNFSKLREVWVFGYGSLMSPDSPPAGLSSRQRKLFLPYWIKKEAGFQRCWNYRHGSVGINALGLQKVPEHQADDICGIAYPMDYEFASDLFSKREDGYRLLLLHEDLMEPMHPDYRIPKGAGYIWIVGEPILKCEGPENAACDNYKCKQHWPTDDSPILQSYVDEIIAGCLKYKTLSGKNDGMNFAAAVCRSIRGWERPWFNDRILAGRPWKFAADYELTDGILNTCPASHDGFVKRKRPGLCASPALGRLYESAYGQSEDWRAQFYGASVALEDDARKRPDL